MKLKNMHLAGPTAAVSMLGLGLLFVTRLTSPTATLNRSRVDPNLRSKNYELSQVFYRFPQQGALLSGGRGRMGLALPRELRSESITLLSPEGFAMASVSNYESSIDAPAGLRFGAEARDGSSYAPSFARSGMSAGFAGGAVMGAIGSGAVASAYRSAPFPASVRASSSVADGATIAAALPDVATAADLTPVGSAAVKSSMAATDVASTEPSALANSNKATALSDLPTTPTAVDRTPVRNVVQAVASNSWASEAIPVGSSVSPKPTSPTTTSPSGPTGTSYSGPTTYLNPVLWVPPVRPADVNNILSTAGSPLPAGLPPLVTPEPSTVALLGAGLLALAYAARRRTP